jgi:hypothetical protein
MKMKILLMAVMLVAPAGCWSGCCPAQDAANQSNVKTNNDMHLLVTLPDGRKLAFPGDFFLGDPMTVSNYNLAKGELPEGWSMVCDKQGHYAAKSPEGTICDWEIECGSCVRTSRWESVMVAWRIKGVWDAPLPPLKLPVSKYSNWDNCTCGTAKTNASTTNTVIVGNTNSPQGYTWNIPTNGFNGMLATNYTVFVMTNPPLVTNGFEWSIYGIRVRGYEVTGSYYYEDFATQLDLSVFPGKIVLRTNQIIWK